MKPLTILWQRLVTEGETCQRCGSTQQNVLRAMDKLETALRPLGIQPALETRQIDDAAFHADPSQSNRIWIAGQALEHWLGATVGDSPCCSVCGDLPCRTVQIGGDTYEAIPEALIVSAAMMAAARMTAPTPPAKTAGACCAAPTKRACCD
ncbi:MAG: DUF2703 domain-containing protein [Rubrivivax sp.]|nr:DUF2703 domain-containing protein [Rubrivivax sp.]